MKSPTVAELREMIDAINTIRVKAGSLHWHEALNGWYLWGICADKGTPVFCDGITTDADMAAYDPNDDPYLLEVYGIEEVDAEEN
jgi:hypothetical protein